MSKRRIRRRVARLLFRRLKRDLLARTKGAYIDDDGSVMDDELASLIHKRHDREQKGRLRLLKGSVSGAARRRVIDALNLLQD